jgi:enoyl-CoA hydratase/carnithine racemase
VREAGLPQVHWERDRRVARVIIGTGVRRNALTSAGWAGIERAVRGLSAAHDLRAVVLEGAAGWFCAGSDIREWMVATSEDVTLSFARMEAACTAIEELAVPVIAKVRGPAAGAGCQLALACDLRFLAVGASMGMPIARLGILISPAFAIRLAAHGGASVAGDLLYTGRMVGALEAVRIGLANACVPGDQLDHHVESVVDDIVGASGAAVRAAKRVIGDLAAPARAAARAATGPPVDEDDFRRGIERFVERRRRAARAAK